MTFLRSTLFSIYSECCSEDSVVHVGDLMVVERSTAWPRAFFAAGIHAYDNLIEFSEMVRISFYEKLPGRSDSKANWHHEPRGSLGMTGYLLDSPPYNGQTDADL
jgi:hypothetical protein